MSTVPEAIAAAQMGVKIGAISCIANSAAGMSHSGITHEEVLEVTARAARKLTAILIEALPRLASLAGR
jgi:purine-nucleoside phosphorylase